MIETDIQTMVLKELQKLEYATRIHNYGMARVCGRRASGMVIGYWLEKEPRSEDYGTSYMSHIKALAADEEIHPDVRAAANRLIANKEFVGNRKMSIDPLSDAVLIIRYVEHKLDEVILLTDRE